MHSVSRRHGSQPEVSAVQCDEIWSFIGAKERNATPEQKAEGWGDIWGRRSTLIPS
jgi:hypothetical protein